MTTLPKPTPALRQGFSLVELLVATTIGLAVMAAIASLFSLLGRSMSQSQSTVELASRLRSTAWQLRQDLAGVTVGVGPWTQPDANSGYFELIEGPTRDTTNTIVSGTPTSNLTGDTDDILLFTTQSVGSPFVGKFDSDTIESPNAEIAWFCRPSANQPVTGTILYNLYRRQLLVVTYVGKAPFLSGNNSIPTASFAPNGDPLYDISMRTDGSAYYPNSLGDLAKRENRFRHASVFPHVFQSDANATFDSTNRVWEDVVLTNVVAFDVKVFDPKVRAQRSSGITLYPGDLAYTGTASTSGTGAYGAYVDLGWGGGGVTSMSGTFPPAGQTAFQSGGVAVRNGATTNLLGSSTFDTWSLHYEFNGLDEDNDGILDEGTNGADNNGDDLPDNPTEFETSPPYPVILRGVEVRIRCYEATSKQVRQITVRHSFINR
jgi:prepilin-type N-terminal cleavage/methylation domain-containing protein